MKTFLVAIFLIALAVITAIFLHQDAGTVQVTFQGGNYTAPLAYVFYVILAAFFALYILLRFVGMIFRAPSTMGKAKSRRAQDAASLRLVAGTLDIGEGQNDRAEKALMKDIPKGPSGVLHYLAAADAAQALGKLEQRDRHLQRAAEHHKGAQYGIDLKRAEGDLESGAAQSAMDSVRALLKTQPRNSRALALFGNALAATANWDELTRSLKDLRKFSSLNEKQVDDLEIQASMALLSEAADNQLENTWKSLSNNARSRTELVGHYAGLLQAAGHGDAAERTLRVALDNNWSDELLEVYGQLTTSSPEQQLNQLQKWVENSEDNAALLAAAGQVSINQELWGKAHSYFEQAAKLNDSPAIQQALARIADNKGDKDAARDHLQRGLELALS